jgi:crotonobetainyl-CoA:carnitine CoA-transferase CaiB-like acyl-CoA transferase
MDCLSGIRVLDLSQYIPGPFATLMLADFGAEVVKIEPPAGDPMRTFGPLEADGTTPFYKSLNAGKVVVRLDLKADEGRGQLERLVSGADVLLESFRPGTLERLGFGPDRLRALNPRLIHCAVSGFGQTGPWRLRAGHDLTYVALTGGLSRLGVEASPVIPFPPLADHAGAMQAVTAILAALVRRGRTGQGAYLDVSLQESALSWQYLALGAGGRDLGRGKDLLNGGAAFYRIYRTQDGRFLAVAPIETKFWHSFCQAAGRPDLIPRHTEPLPQTSLIAELEALLAQRTLAEWVRVFEPADCCVEPVLEPAEVFGQNHAEERGFLQSDGQVLLPVLLDGVGRPPREPFREIAVAALEDW